MRRVQRFISRLRNLVARAWDDGRFREELGMVLNEATTISVVGIAGGMTLTFLLSALVKPLLYGLKPDDPLILTSAAVLRGLVGLAASCMPARRAAAVEPMRALRQE